MQILNFTKKLQQNQHYILRHSILHRSMLHHSILLRSMLHHSILHHGHRPPWLGISSMITPGVLRIPTFWQEISSTKANRPLAYGLFQLYPVSALMVGPYANRFELSYTTTLSYTTDTILPGSG